MRRFEQNLDSPKRIWPYLLLPIALVIIEAAVRAALLPILQETPYIIFLPGVVVSALYGGFWLGLSITLLSALAASVWFGPGQPAQFDIPGHLPGITTFLAVNIAVVGICSRLRSTKQHITQKAQKLQQSEKALEAEVIKRKLSEESALRAKDEWDRTFDSVPDLVAILDSQHRIIRVNRAMAERLGVTPEKAVGMHCYEAVHGTQGPPDFCPHVLTCKDTKEHTAEVHEERIGGDFLVTTTPLCDDEGRLTGSVHVARDITERKRIEEALRENERDLNRAQSVANTGSWRLDVRRNELAWSDQTYRIFGIPKGTPLTYETFLAKIHPDDREYVDRKWNAALKGERYDIEHRIVVDGGIKWVREKAEMEFDSQGGLIGGFGAVQDITERKDMEDALRRSNENLEQFAHVASHDLQEPLRMMASYSQLLEKRYESRLDADAKEFIGYIVDGATRMQVLINDLLAYSRVGRGDKPASEIDCNLVIGKVINGLKLAIEEKRAVVTNDKLPTVKGNESELIQLFQNLIGNAIKFHAEEPPRVHISTSKNEGEWVFSVRDNGIGIEPQYKDRIFLVFQRLHDRGKYPGTGIGLSICKKIVETQGGCIWVESEEGKGSTFYFTIPAKEVSENERRKACPAH